MKSGRSYAAASASVFTVASFSKLTWVVSETLDSGTGALANEAFNVAFGLIELCLAVYIFRNVRRDHSVALLFSTGMWLVFLVTSITRRVLGIKDCGCFGWVSFEPKDMLVFDFCCAVVGFVILYRDRGAFARVLHKKLWFDFASPGNVGVFVASLSLPLMFMWGGGPKPIEKFEVSQQIDAKRGFVDNKYHSKIKMENSTGDTVWVAGVSRSCSCVDVSANFPVAISDNETGYIDFVIDLTSPGSKHPQTLTLYVAGVTKHYKHIEVVVPWQSASARLIGSSGREGEVK